MARFDDIESVQRAVGGEPGPFGPAIEITLEMIDRFADLTNDHNWIHVDAERCARESPYRRTIAHGFLVISLIPGLDIPEPLEITGFAFATHYGCDRARFARPVPSGSRIHARMRLKAAQMDDARLKATWEILVHVVGEEKPAAIYEMLVPLTISACTATTRQQSCSPTPPPGV